MCTSVASRVHGTTGEPCSSWPWWLRMMWSTAVGQRLGKPGMSSISAPDPVVAERDLALELAEVGEVDGQRVARVGVELADVVQQRAGDRHVAVDARERGGDDADGLARRRASARAARGGRPGGSAWRPVRRGTRGHVGASGPSTRSSSCRRCGFWTWATSSRRPPPCARPSAAGRPAGRPRSYSCGSAGRRSPIDDLGAVAGVDLVAAGDVHARAGLGLGQVVARRPPRRCPSGRRA